ncbi:F-box protein CPR1-like [Argentina anserina]|uniref:F-box protein CPR1-like n=1 Tax=Argentina anserina TaxID=57926 RepID=UPI0021764185|nr:F-box protein CPR1-like [Potentilla anserina]
MAEQIPKDVMIKVLERLPVKSLIRFACVSKRWRFIILFDPQSAKAHYEVSRERQTIRRRFLITTSVRFELNSIDFDTSSFDGMGRIPFEQPGIKSWSFLCSCNGLVCATVSISTAAKLVNHMYIWNPSTGFLKKLPDPSMNVYPVFYGMGYLSATGDYKIIKPGQILSLRTNVWKPIHIPFNYLYAYEGIRVNEALHWFDEHNPGVVAFDLATEGFRTMPLPHAFKVKNRIRLAASVGRCLCALDYVRVKFHEYGSIDLWVMRDYGVADSWTKLFNCEFNDWCIIESGHISVWDTSIIF